MSQELIYSIIFILWIGRTIFATSSHVYQWQLKEYRLDRYLDHIKTKKRVDPFFLMRIVSAFALLFLTAATNGLIFLLIPFNYLLENLFALRSIVLKKFQKPQLTKKAASIFAVTIFSQITPITYYIIKNQAFTNHGLAIQMGFLLFPFLLTFLLPLIVIVLVLILKPFTQLAKKKIYEQAKQKIQQLPSLTVIGITGSYGKTSTKEFLASILSEKFSVLKTAKNINTEIGVAQTVLHELKPKHQIFVVEMGAYKKGEIKTICDIVKPKIGIITAIASQHLALFGSFENLLAAKLELIESLPLDGLAILNGDNAALHHAVQKVASKKAFFSSKNKTAGIYANKIIEHTDGLKFCAKINNKEVEFETKLYGRQNIPNLLAAIYCASYLGVKLSHIQAVVKAFKPFPRTMEKFTGKNGFILIDDTYNANPDGIIAALNYLKLYQKADPTRKRVIIMPGMLELGFLAASSHELVGEAISSICDYAIFLNRDFYDDIMRGFQKVPKANCISYQTSSASEILQLINSQIGHHSIILFESRGAEKVIDSLKFL